MTSSKSIRNINKVTTPPPASVLANRQNLLDEPQPDEKNHSQEITTTQIINQIKFDFDDVSITPATQTGIESRYEENVTPHYNSDFYKHYSNDLPLFTAPMDTVVNEATYRLFINAGINVVLPRTEKNKSNPQT